MDLLARSMKGRLVFAEPAALAIILRKYEGQELEVSINRRRYRRSNQQNAFYWAAIVPLVRHVIDEERAESGQPPINWHPSKWRQDIHDALVVRHAGVEDTAIGPVRKRTSSMDTGQFLAFTQSVARWLAEKGYYVPEPGEAA